MGGVLIALCGITAPACGGGRGGAAPGGQAGAPGQAAPPEMRIRRAHRFISRDAAVTWQAVGPQLPSDITVTGIAVQGAYYLLGTSGRGVLRSSATALAWAAVNHGLPRAPDVLAFRAVGDTVER